MSPHIVRNGTPHLYSEEHSPAHEAAILFAAGFTKAALALLEAQVEEASTAERQTWLVLFDAYRAAGLREEFEGLLVRYETAFPLMALPAWPCPAAIDTPGTLALHGVLTKESGCLAAVHKHAAGRRTMAIDMSQVARIDFGFIGEFAAALRTFHVQGKRVILANISELNAAALEAVDAQHAAAFMRRKGCDPRTSAATPSLLPPMAVAA